ncbi:NAD(P)-dependent dehydrogenase (short-subunit alcohol dehydrogenase family) [Wenyingzhuangia heitensis]|uniref:NAD(P)-dependent dehydrogenase (Short-subunit alcohol dehydrogenase family) n=1 Tax=Wenyingzhuangia heitensis TaxID=1487859 RepID=A0ABX0U9B4_9FLAO|nr:SDR family oxidoreductase [Wenyingzhuangia heitensis]NIJ44949.1 NAD(P)-dependent dehydrogenase (short-subunit alcohol dehydrogenase family) [Wenyingzhuangia heitensis]
MNQKIIVITGASGGVGSMLALGLAKKGNYIVCLGRNKEALLNLANKINNETQSVGGEATIELVDMMDAEAVEVVAKKIKKQFGRIDVWINNVGVNNHNAIGPTWELEPKNWWNEVALNLNTAYIGSAIAINLMKAKNYGYVINLGGGGVQKPKSYGSAYGAAKTAIVKFTETLALELEAENLEIKTFAFNPGFIRNKRTEKLVDSDVCKKYMPRLENTLKHGKMSNIEDSIEMIEVLISGKANALTGRYFLADDDEMKAVLLDVDKYVQKGLGLLHLKK